MKQLLNTYGFVPVSDPQGIGEVLHSHALQLSLKGTLLIAREGFNFGLWGASAALDDFCGLLADRIDVSGAQQRRSVLDASPFGRLRLKVRDEIITFEQHVDHALNEGRFVEPEDVEDWIRDPAVALLDTRNDYESAIGTFRGAVTLPIQSFTELAEQADALAERFRGKKVLSFCTGGVRCEKAVPYLRARGVDAYQLRGGILAYVERHPEGLWEGECFVFDDRYSVQSDGGPGSYRACVVCGQPARAGKCIMCGAADSSADGTTRG